MMNDQHWKNSTLLGTREMAVRQNDLVVRRRSCRQSKITGSSMTGITEVERAIARETYGMIHRQE